MEIKAFPAKLFGISKNKFNLESRFVIRDDCFCIQAYRYYLLIDGDCAYILYMVIIFVETHIGIASQFADLV